MPWTTLPPLADNTIHRYDLMKAAIEKPDAKRCARCSSASRRRCAPGGGCGSSALLNATEPGKAPLIPPPAPDPNLGWGRGRVTWSPGNACSGIFCRAHAADTQALDPSKGYNVSGLEEHGSLPPRRLAALTTHGAACTPAAVARGPARRLPRPNRRLLDQMINHRADRHRQSRRIGHHVGRHRPPAQPDAPALGNPEQHRG